VVDALVVFHHVRRRLRDAPRPRPWPVFLLLFFLLARQFGAVATRVVLFDDSPRETASPRSPATSRPSRRRRRR
ncbi:unnamed protein product, partial [Ixodes pacificus]